MTYINRLDWDSSFFGYEVGRLEISSAQTFDYLKMKKESEKFQLIYIFSAIKLRENHHLRLVDEKVTLHQEIDLTALKLNKKLNFDISSFNRNKHNINELKQLALESGIYSRFYIDSNFRSNEYQKLYLHWIENCINGNLAFDILVASDKNKMLGFTTVNKKSPDIANIGLVAVDSFSRGNGIGFNLINKTIIKAEQAGFRFIQVVTQLNNVPAIKLYEKTNFKIKEVINIYHYWNLQ